MQTKAIALGEQLVALLEDSPHADTFSRWAAQYIAEQMTLAESAQGEERAAARDKAYHAILALWTQRNHLPDGLRPFQGFDPILRALTRLDPENTRSLYPDFSCWRNEVQDPDKVTKLVEAALSLDRTARILLNFLFTEAAGLAEKPETKALLEHALPSSLTGDLESISEIRRRREVLEPGGDLSADVLARKRERIEQLKSFRHMCAQITKDLESELAKASAEIPPSKKPAKKNDPSKK